MAGGCQCGSRRQPSRLGIWSSCPTLILSFLGEAESHQTRCIDKGFQLVVVRTCRLSSGPWRS